jgi:hypothetical protein
MAGSVRYQFDLASEAVQVSLPPPATGALSDAYPADSPPALQSMTLQMQLDIEFTSAFFGLVMIATLGYIIVMGLGEVAIMTLRRWRERTNTPRWSGH